MHELVIRNGTIVDGSGIPAYEGDLAIDGDRISAVGGVVGPGRRELDAEGKLVTPGWVDVHTHYDAQVTWDPYLTPSGWHGVTTVVMGNCGVGFAPVRPDRHAWLIGLMEGVEDIPGAALTEGIRWGWENFPEYLDALERMPRALDVAAQVPHGALRAYVMGERGARNEPATGADIAEMARLVREGIEAGAVGFSTSRTLLHRSAIDGEPVPGTYAAEDELFGLGQALEAAGAGVFQMTTNHGDLPLEFPWMRRLAKETGRPVVFNLVQVDESPNLWRAMLRRAEEAYADGAYVFPQVAGRPAGVLMGWQTTAHPFLAFAEYQNLCGLPFPQRVARLRDPSVRERILADTPIDLGAFGNMLTTSFHKMFLLGEEPEYEPAPEHSVAAIAARTGKSPLAVVYDAFMEHEGKGLLYLPFFNYAGGDMEPLREMLLHPLAHVGLGDGGAHCGVICDASIPTYLLTHWVRDRARGGRIPLEHAVQKQTRDTASLYGLHDRGILTPGFLADVNIIDHERLRLHAPKMVYDLPAGGRRLVQGADGYLATIKRGQVIYEEGQATGALPGQLVRGPQVALLAL